MFHIRSIRSLINFTIFLLEVLLKTNFIIFQDDEVELQFDDRAKISSIKQVAENGNNKNSKESTPASKVDEEEDGEDDVDIDDI